MQSNLFRCQPNSVQYVFDQTCISTNIILTQIGYKIYRCSCTMKINS